MDTDPGGVGEGNEWRGGVINKKFKEKHTENPREEATSKREEATSKSFPSQRCKVQQREYSQ